MAVKNFVASSCELYVFENSEQIRHDISGYNVPIEKRAINSMTLCNMLFMNMNQDGGTGIGLFIAKTIVEQKLRGKIEVHNDKNGAVFKLLF